MKKLVIFSAIFATFLFGCKTQQKSAGYTYDDVYSTGSGHVKVTSKPKIQNEDLSGSQKVVLSDSSSTLSSTSAASTEDYSSNSYEARIKRFNDKNPGLDYNNEFYSGSSDSTSSSGSSPNISLYFGNSWGSSMWGPSFSFGIGYGWGDCWSCYPYSWGYPYGWYYPYYWDYPYYGYYPYSYWYWEYPYWGGYYNHYGDYGNGYHNDYYYGQRRSLSTPDGGRNSRTTTTGINPESGQVKNSRANDPGTVNRTADQVLSGRAEINRVPPDKQHYRYTRSTTQENTRALKNNPNTRTRPDRSYAQRQEPSPRYTRPGTQKQVTRSDAQNYSSPAYRQPKSSQEYINPRTQQSRPAGVNRNSSRNFNPGSSTPSGKRYSSPSNAGSNSKIYSNPSGGNRNYSTPSRSYSSPGNSAPSRSSSPSYSAPSRSYSSPSNSGRSSGSSGSGSGSGGGGGRRR